MVTNTELAEQSSQYLPQVLQLLTSGRYEEAAAVLEATEEAAEEAGDPVLSTVLEATRQICLAGSDYQTEAELHRQAYQAATAREQQLRQQLQALLTIITARLTSSAGKLAPAQPQTTDRRREIPPLLKRLQGLLGLPDGTAPRNSLTFYDKDVEQDHLYETPSIEMADSELTLSALEKIARAGADSDERRRARRSKTEQPSLAVYFLPTLRVYDNDRLIDEWTGNKCKLLLKYMVLHRDRPVHRDILIDLLWREEEPESARRNLYQTVYVLRQAFQANNSDFQYILCENSCYLLNPELELWVDFETFLKHYETGQRLERANRMADAIQEYEAAENLYEGEFLVEDLYEDWTLTIREKVKHAYLDLLDRVSRYYWSRNNYALSIAYCQKILLADPCREDAHRRLMLAYVSQGHRHLALRQYHRCVQAFQQELDTDPMPATVELYEKIKRNDI